MPRSLFVDWPSNTGNPKIQMTLLAFRSCQALMGDIKNPKPVSYPAVLLYRLITEVVLSMELRPTTKVGAPLTIHHGFSLVVNPDAVIGDRVQLRNGVVIGNRAPGGACPRIEDDVEVGAGAVIIGGVTVGKGARVGAAAVVIADVPANAAVVGNPGRVILPRVSG